MEELHKQCSRLPGIDISKLKLNEIIGFIEGRNNWQFTRPNVAETYFENESFSHRYFIKSLLKSAAFQLQDRMRSSFSAQSIKRYGYFSDLGVEIKALMQSPPF